VRRHLLPSEARAALDRGATIEQFLGLRPDVDRRPTLAYVWLAGGRSLAGRLEHRFDEGDPDHLDVNTFGEVDELGTDWDPESGALTNEGYRYFESADQAFEWAAGECGAPRDRWVNTGVVQDEYRDAHGWRR